MDCFGACFTHAQTCDSVRVQIATLYGLLRYMTHAQTCDNVRGQSATLWTAFGTCFSHAQTCDNVRVQTATLWSSVHALHMPNPVIMFVFKVLRYGLLRYMLFTCPKPWQRSCSKCYAMDCFGTCFTHAQTCDNVRVQSATLWSWVHALHMPKPVITFVFKVLRYGLLRYMTHAQTCDNLRVQSATLWTASVHALHMPKPVITFVFKVLRYAASDMLYTCPDLW